MQIKQGQVVVDSWALVHDTDAFKVWHVDLRTKRCGWSYVWPHIGGQVVCLFPNDGTVDANEDAEHYFTEIILDELEDDPSSWVVLAENSRYNVYIAAWRSPGIDDDLDWVSV